MPPRITRRAGSRQKGAGTQRTPQSQTSGIFKLPFELLLEIFSYLKDHRGFIRQIGLSMPPMEKEDVERSTVIRRLTMTCWTLRKNLLPILWEDAEACAVYNYPGRGYTYGLYAQCEYLLANPIVASYVQVLSVHLCFKYNPQDLMRKFIDTLLRLPNLRRLNLLGVTHRSPVTAALEHEWAIFPNIREMVVDRSCPDFIKSCPNLESLTFRCDLDDRACGTIELYGGGLKRVTGIGLYAQPDYIAVVVQSCPKLQEIGLLVDLHRPIAADHIFDQLRRIEHLAIVDVDFIKYKSFIPLQDTLEVLRNAWKRGLIEVLKDSTTRDRKLLRWCTIDRRFFWNLAYPGDYEIIESGKMEVFPETSLY